MTSTTFQALSANAALLLAIALVFDLASDKGSTFASRAGHEVAAGVVVGAIGLAVMSMPLPLLPGVVFDTRSVLLGICGLFFAPATTFIAMAIAAALRLHEGGAGAWTGVGVIAATGLIGIAWRRLRRGPLAGISVLELYLFGLVLHVAMLAILLTLPPEIVGVVFSKVAGEVLLIYPVATALLGFLLARQLRQDVEASRLRESEERLRLALAGAKQGLWDLDLRTGRAFVDDRYARMIGRDPAVFRETNEAWRERLHPEDREPVFASFRAFVEGRLPEYRVEFRQLDAEGGWRWILSQGDIVERDPDGRPTRMVGTHIDITDRKEAEERLRDAQAKTNRLLAESDHSRLALLSVVEDLQEADRKIARSEAFHRGLFENLHEGFAYCRLVREDGQPRDFVFLRVNDSFERMRGVSGIEGLRANDAFPGIHDSNPEILAACARVVDSGDPELFESFVAAIDRWFLVSAYRPEPGHFVSVFIDVTFRKAAELEIRQRMEELKRWHDITLGREGRIIELKEEVNALRKSLGMAARYSADANEDGGAPAQANESPDLPRAGADRG